MNIKSENLENFESSIRKMGYIRYSQFHRNSDFQYWKKFKINDEYEYQIGLLFYDHNKYISGMGIGIQFECMLLGGKRIDLSVSMDISVEKFEIMALDFYKTMKKYD